VVYLEIENQTLSASEYAQLAHFSNLNRLKLSGSNIKDQDLKALKNAQQLISLNLYDTSISDEGLSTVLVLPSLERLFLYQTSVSPEAVLLAKDQYPDLDINTGNTFSDIIKPLKNEK